MTLPAPAGTPRRRSKLPRAAGGFAPCLVVFFVLLVTGCSEDDPVAPPPVPTVSSVSATNAVPGDTIVIGGKNFATPAANNAVYFGNPYGPAVPYAASPTRLSVVVPRNAASGSVLVKVTGQSVAGAGPKLEVTRAVGDVWVFGGANAKFTLKLPFPDQNTQYLLIPHATNAATPYNQLHSYNVTPQGTPVFPAPGAAERNRPVTVTGREAFDLTLNNAAGEVATAVGGLVPAPAKTSGALRAPAQVRQFNVFNTSADGASTLDPANYTRVTAQLRHTGNDCLIYSDVDTLATGNLTLAQIKNFGDAFDDQIRPTNTTYFGTESDVDGNEKVIILITPVVNRLTPRGSNWYIGGFFLAVDLFAAGGGIPAGTTNHAEIFYVLASDPGGFWSLEFPDTFVAEEDVKTIAHEYEHLISYSFRLNHYGFGAVQATWLEEGMAHMAEDLNGLDSSNIGRANSYLADPGNVSLEHNLAPVEQRGGIYLFLRYLGDRFDESIYKSLLQSKCVGRQCIENITGENFYETVDDFLATLYLSGKSITLSPIYNYHTINLGDFGPVKVTSRSIGAGQVSGTIYRTSGDLYLFGNTGSSAVEFTIVDLTGAGLRTVVVRTR